MKFVCGNPWSTLMEVRDEAIMWSLEDSKPGGKSVKAQTVFFEVVWDETVFFN